MESTTLICKRCKAPLEYDESSSVLKCPNCGYSELIKETDKVKIAQIQSHAMIRKAQIENDTDLKQDAIQLEARRISFKKTKLILIAIAAIAIVVFIGWLGYKIKHRNEIRVPLSAEAYCMKDYEEAYRLLEDAGFTNIEYVVQETLPKDKQNRIGDVTQVSINGQTAFDEKARFRKDAVVKITYTVLDPARADDIAVPVSYKNCIGKNYQKIIEQFSTAGFDNIEAVPKADLSMDRKENVDVITDISIEKDSQFHQGDYYPPDVAVRITYHTLDPERMTDVQIPEEYDYYEGMDYIEACKKFQEVGFINIILMPTYDVKFYEESKSGVVQYISIDGSHVFKKDSWFPYDTDVRIAYRTKGLDYIGKSYLDMERMLSDMGFVDVDTIPMADLGPDELKKKDTVQSIQINGEELSSVTELPLSSPVVIRYHSERQAADNQIKITYSSKNFIGKKYQEVINNLAALGFTNIKTLGVRDTSNGLIHKTNDVADISIGGVQKFSAGEIFDKDAEIVVQYYSKETGSVEDSILLQNGQITAAVSSETLKGQGYKDVMERLTSIGFTNIKEVELEDLKKYQLYKYGDVEEVSIDGITDFSENDIFDKDAEVIVTYHTFE